MTRPKKPPSPRPALAWCALCDGEIAPGWCADTRKLGREWSRENGGKLIRVEIRPAPSRAKRRKVAPLRWVETTNMGDALESVKRQNANPRRGWNVHRPSIRQAIEAGSQQPLIDIVPIAKRRKGAK